MDIYKIKNWAVVDGFYGSDPYKAPEQRVPCLKGEVYGHPKFEDGTIVVTTPIVKSEGTWVGTKSGTTYDLSGEPEAGWLEYLDLIGFKFDPENPVSFKDSVTNE